MGWEGDREGAACAGAKGVDPLCRLLLQAADFPGHVQHGIALAGGNHFSPDADKRETPSSFSRD